jgi:hypothetical protein
VVESIIERHEDVARLAMISIAAAALMALAALFAFKWQAASRVLKMVVLLLSLTSGGLMAQTAHLGGQIRHSEIRNGLPVQNSNESNSEHND